MNHSQAEKKVVGYCRVPTPAQKDDLRTQAENVKTYMYAKGYQFEIIEDIGSGINYRKNECGLVIDRNFNVSLNLANYQSA